MDEALRIAAMYAISIIVVALGGSVFLFLVFPFVQVFRQTEFFLLVTGFLLNAASNYAAVYVIVRLCHLLLVEPVILMVVIPLILTIHNGVKRMRRRQREAAIAADNRAEEETEDKMPADGAGGIPVKVEFAMLLGDVGGLWAGIYSFFEYAPWY